MIIGFGHIIFLMLSQGGDNREPEEPIQVNQHNSSVRVGIHSTGLNSTHT